MFEIRKRSVTSYLSLRIIVIILDQTNQFFSRNGGRFIQLKFIRSFSTCFLEYSEKMKNFVLILIFVFLVFLKFVELSCFCAGIERDSLICEGVVMNKSFIADKCSQKILKLKLGSVSRVFGCDDGTPFDLYSRFPDFEVLELNYRICHCFCLYPFAQRSPILIGDCIPIDCSIENKSTM